MLIGLVLIVIGIIALAYQGITYTTREKIVDVGPIEATAETKNHPVAADRGRRSITGGLLMVFTGAKRT